MNVSTRLVTPRAPTGLAVRQSANRGRWPKYEQDEIDAVVEVLESGRVNSLIHGDQCRAFESEFAAACEAPFAISVANGTLALELALRAVGVGDSDEVIVPARSFFATTSAVVAVGATPVFADIDVDSHTIDPGSVRALIGSRTRAILCVHLAGWPCAMEDLTAIANEHGLLLVEDCAQAHGARYRGRPVGSFGDAAAFSFCTDKIMSTGGEGGMLLLKNEEHWARAWSYKDHGKDPFKMREPSNGPGYRYVHDSFGTNMRLTEMQAAIGRVQLSKLPGWLARRRRNAATLSERLAGRDLLRLPDVPAHIEHAFYKYYLCIDAVDSCGPGLRDRVLQALARLGLATGAGSCPDMSAEGAVASLPFAEPALPVAKLIGKQSIMLPVDHLLGDEEMLLMADAIINTIEPARRSMAC